MMNPEERERQNKLLSKLDWMTERCQRDFKGNPPPFEHAITMQSVQKKKRQERQTLAGDRDFMPFWRSTTPLAVVATRTDYLHDVDHSKFDATLEKAHQRASHQRIDPETGLTDIQAALCWNAPIRNPRRDPAPATFVSVSSPREATNHRLVNQHLLALPPQERTAAYREELMSHPMYTKESVEVHRDRWAHGTQLEGPIIAPPRRRHSGHGAERRNQVRMVVYERGN